MMHNYAKFACIVSASKADLIRYWADRESSPTGHRRSAAYSGA